MSAGGDAALVASLFAVDPVGTGGVCIRSPVHPARDQWLQLLREVLPADEVLRRIPFNISDGRLLGGLDLVATIAANRPVAERGVLAGADGGVVVVAMAERLSARTAACLNAVLDAGEVTLPREGVVIRSQARLGLVALDEGISEEESVPASLRDRLAFQLDFNGFDMRTILVPAHVVEQILAARTLLPQVQFPREILSSLCAAALAVGAGSPRVSMLASRVARAAAALDGRIQVGEEDAAFAGRLVLAPRATLLPAQPQEAPPQQDSPPRQENPPPPENASPPENAPTDPPDDPPQLDAGESRAEPSELTQSDIDNIVLAATQSAIPSGLLDRLRTNAGKGGARSGGGGRAGALRNKGSRGRPFGVHAGSPGGDARLNVIETLRAAAPWQRLRGRNVQQDSRVLISREDFRVTRYRQRAQTLTIFAVDVSGSSALHRLAEAKGAVELLLADCYVRRDQVAVIAFRGRTAEVLLPPTRSLVRAKRSLAALPGGGGTPLAAAIESAAHLALQAVRRGETPTIVMLTDGRANVARNGTGGRDVAQADANRAARAVRAFRLAALFIDTSPRPNPLAQDLSRTMNAQYIPLPFADGRAVSDVVKAAAARPSSRIP